MLAQPRTTPIALPSGDPLPDPLASDGRLDARAMAELDAGNHDHPVK